MISKRNESYEKGDFPEGEHAVGGVVLGRPPLSTDKIDRQPAVLGSSGLGSTSP